MPGKQIVAPGGADHKAFQHSQAVRAGDPLLLASQCPMDARGNTVAPSDARSQTRQVFEHLKAVLAAAGLTLNDLVELVSHDVNLADLPDLPVVAEVKAVGRTRDFPTWTAVGVTALAFPCQLLDLKATGLAGCGSAARPTRPRGRLGPTRSLGEREGAGRAASASRQAGPLRRRVLPYRHRLPGGVGEGEQAATRRVSSLPRRQRR